jgi:hypothetical protein
MEKNSARKWALWLLVAVAVVALVAYPCTVWSLVPASIVGAVAGTVLAWKVWKARSEVFAAPAMIVVGYGVCGLGAFGLWAVVIALRCLGHGATD